MHYYHVIISSQVVGYFTVVGGLGFGVASGAIMFSNVLKSSAGPGTVGIFGDSSLFILESGKHIYVTIRLVQLFLNVLKVHLCICICVHACMHTCVRVCVCLCACVYVYLCACVCMRACVC